MQSKRLIIIGFILLFVKSFCFSQKARVFSKDKGAKIMVLEYNYYNDRIDTVFIGSDSAEYKFKTDEALFYVEKKGYRPTSYLVLKKSIKSKKQKVLFDALTPIPQKESNNKYISVEKVSFNVKSKDYKKKYFEDYINYLENKLEHSSNLEEDLIVENSIFDNRLERFLLKQGFVDTTNKLTLSDFNNVDLQININSVTENKIGKFVLVQVSGSVNVDNKISNKKIEFDSKSSITYEYDSKNENGGLKPLFEEALERALIRIWNDPLYKDLFKKSDLEASKIAANWPIITISDKEESSSLENSVESVVTITQKSGHGSGCVISKNGYIITNHHVIGYDSLNVFVLLSNGVKKKCRVVRSNPEYDLTLLKVDTVFAHNLKINREANIKVGSDVYAIGTPKDIDLGQSVAKGIISGKRKFDGKEYIQTDVSINSGNSGGALTNKTGELIGVVNAKLVGKNVEGVGFAIPAHYIEQALRIEIK